MIELISEIKQKNNGVFPLIDNNNIRGGIYSVISIQDRDNIPRERQKYGMLCYVQEKDKYYKLVKDALEYNHGKYFEILEERPSIASFIFCI